MSTTIYSSPLDSILYTYIQLLTLQSVFTPLGAFRFMVPLLLQRSQGAFALQSVASQKLHVLKEESFFMY